MPGNHGVAATPDHPSFPSARASQALLRYSRRRVEALDLLSLGASILQTFRKVVLPLARAGLVACGPVHVLIAWNSYVWALVLTTDSSMYVMSVGIANMVGDIACNGTS